MSHNQCTHQTSRNTPWSSPNILHLVFLVNELNIECLCKVLSQKVGSTTLQCFSVLHHGFYCVSVKCTCKTFIGWFHSLYNGNSHIFFCKFTIYIQHSDCFFLCFFTGSMSGMSLLPQEFGSTQEKTGTHFPTENVRPLVTENRQVTVWLNPVLISIPDDCFWCRTDNQFLFQFSCRIYYNSWTVFRILQTIMCYYGTLFRKPFYVFCFAA